MVAYIIAGGKETLRANAVSRLPIFERRPTWSAQAPNWQIVTGQVSQR
jgi:hypothetical protein